MRRSYDHQMQSTLRECYSRRRKCAFDSKMLLNPAVVPVHGKIATLPRQRRATHASPCASSI